jgi:hypothetical protein
MTFSITKEFDHFQIQAKWGQYTRTRSEVLTEESGKAKLVWQRKQIDSTSDPIPLSEGKFGPWSPEPEFPDVQVKGLIRDKGDAWTISLYLVNNQEEPEKLKDQAWLFQPELHVFHPEHLPVFIKRQTMAGDLMPNIEDRRMEMNYRRHLEFVVGHGVGAHATLSEVRWDRAVEVETKVIPSFEVLRMEAPDPEQMPRMSGLLLDMKSLANLEKGAFADALMPLIDAYDQWITSLENQRSDDLLPYQNDAELALRLCRENLSRIKQGILLIDQDENAARAFKFANRAMADQRTRTIYSRLVRQGKTPDIKDIDIPKNRSWRPF